MAVYGEDKDKDKDKNKYNEEDETSVITATLCCYTAAAAHSCSCGEEVSSSPFGADDWASGAVIDPRHCSTLHVEAYPTACESSLLVRELGIRDSDQTWGSDNPHQPPLADLLFG